MNFSCTNSSSNHTDSTCPVDGPIEYLSIEAIIVLDILYVIIVIIGFTGNVMTCTATIIQKSMRRSIHLYVFNLAVCDLLILTFYVPNEMMRMGNHARFIWGSGMCVLTSTVLPVAVNSTVFTLLAISIDRARGVLQPFEWRADAKGSARVALPIIWVVSVSMAVPVIMHAKKRPFNCGYVCTDAWESTDQQATYWYTMFALTFIVPLVIIFVLHLVMIYMINYELAPSERHANNMMIKMTVSIVIIFTLCTGSQHFYFFILTFYPCLPETDTTTDAILFFGSNMLVTVQSACNPIIYSKFREDFNVAYKRMVEAVGRMLRNGRLMLSKEGITVYSSLKPREVVENGEVTSPLPSKSNLESRESRSSLQVPVNNNSINANGTLNTFYSSLDDITRNPTFDANTDIRIRKSSTFDETLNREENIDSENLDFRPFMRSPSEIDENNVIENDSEPVLGPSAITYELRNISRLLNELRDTEVLDNLRDTARLSREFLRLTEDEKKSLRSSYPSVEWLEVLHLLRDSKETDL